MEEEKVKEKKIIFFMPLIFAVMSILFLLGTVLTYSIKYTPADATKAVKEYFDIHLWDMFNTSFTPSWPVICILTLFVWAGIAPIFGLFTKDKVRENFALSSTFSFLFGVCFLAAYKELFSYFATDLIPNYHSSDIGYGTALSLLAATIGAFLSLMTSGKKYGENVQAITEDGILIALAFVFNFIKLPISTGAGSVNLQMLPLFLIALRRGPLHGFISGGIVYGMLTCLTEGYGLFTYPFDYLVGFGSVAVLGFFSKLIMPSSVDAVSWGHYSLKGELYLLLAGVLATLLRFLGSSVSSMVFYQLSFPAACLYNAIYIPVSGAIALGVLLVLYGPLCHINAMFPPEQER